MITTMMGKTMMVLLAAAIVATGFAGQTDYMKESKAARDKRMQWFRDARFGMFIHWGLYAQAAGNWNGKEIPGAAEWILNTAQIKVADYEKMQKEFNPTQFNADEWVRIAKNAGMKYIVITSKHHEGFAMWDTKLTDWGIMNTPFHRDVLKELAGACKKEGIKLCFYHSIMDWHHPDYLPRRPWDPRPDVKADFPKYVAYMKAQLKELLTNYGDIGLLWFDGEWEATWTHEQGKDLYNYVRSLQPKIIVNNRVDTGRTGMAGMTEGDHAGDYGTPEQEIPASGLPGVDWESCMTMNDTWGFSSHDHNWKSSETLIKNLVDIASKGGNYLLNVGPEPTGVIPPASVERLAAMGTWMKRNGEAIYHTTASPFIRPLAWGRITQKPGIMYVHIFDRSQPTVTLTGLSVGVKSIYQMGDPLKRPVAYQKTAEGITIQLPSLPDEPVAVLVMEVSGKPKVVVPPIKQAADGRVNLTANDAVTKGSLQVEADKQAIGYWTNPKDTVRWDFVVQKPGTFNVEIELACEDPSAGSTYEVSIGSQRIQGTVPKTGGWNKFVTVQLGSIQIAKAGKTTLTVTPVNKTGLGVMNLRAIRLSPR